MHTVHMCLVGWFPGYSVAAKLLTVLSWPPVPVVPVVPVVPGYPNQFFKI